MGISTLTDSIELILLRNDTGKVLVVQYRLFNMASEVTSNQMNTVYIHFTYIYNYL